MKNLINLTDEQIEKRFNDLGYDPDIDNLIYTRETIEDFKNARFEHNEPGSITHDKENELIIEGLQTFKGQPRKDVVVIDFGDVRAVVKS